MASIRVYITPFDVNGTYAAEQEVTSRVITLGRIELDTDSAEFQVGVYRVANMKLELSNRDGKFSDVDVEQSIFRYKRADAKVRITWLDDVEFAYCGTAICGEAHLGDEVEIFRGLLNDDAFALDARQEKAVFNVLGYQTLFERVEIPFASISVADAVSVTLYKILNQTVITNYLTVSQVNIVPGLDQVPDSIADLETLSVKEALDILLRDSNSVLFIKNNIVYVNDRSATASVQYTFYGQASQEGPENIADIQNIRNGMHRVFNYWNWEDTTVKASDSNSVLLNGFRKKIVGSSLFTNGTKQLNFINDLLASFKDPKMELELTADLNYNTLGLDLLDRVNIDYPTVFVPVEHFPLPICGIAVCGEAVLPRGLWNLTISPDTDFKILKKSFDPTKNTVTFKLREI